MELLTEKQYMQLFRWEFLGLKPRGHSSNLEKTTLRRRGEEPGYIEVLLTKDR